jgi:Tol biopolymer transport system component
MKNKTLIINLVILILGILFTSCSDNSVTPGSSGPPSNITRSGKFITFTSNLGGNYDIYLAQVDANGVLATSELVYPVNPFDLTGVFNILSDKQSNWSPDGKILVFWSARPSGDEDIYAYFFRDDGSIDSSICTESTPKLLITASGKWCENPFFSPDGAHLIFDRRGAYPDSARDIWMGDVTGSGNTYAITNIRMITTPDGKDKYNAKWSPRISVGRVAYEVGSSATATDHDIYIMDPLNPSTNSVFYNPGRSGYPAWAPSCDRIIFESDQGNNGFYQIVSLAYPTNNGNPAVIVTSPDRDLRYPTWLPNGNLLAYINVNPVGSYGNIYTIPSGGGSTSKLLPSSFDGADNTYPAW